MSEKHKRTAELHAGNSADSPGTCSPPKFNQYCSCLQCLQSVHLLCNTRNQMVITSCQMFHNFCMKFLAEETSEKPCLQWPAVPVQCAVGCRARMRFPVLVFVSSSGLAITAATNSSSGSGRLLRSARQADLKAKFCLS